MFGPPKVIFICQAVQRSKYTVAVIKLGKLTKPVLFIAFINKKSKDFLLSILVCNFWLFYYEKCIKIITA